MKDNISLKKFMGPLLASLFGLLVSCGPPATRIEEQLLATDNPFGFVWEEFSIPGAESDESPVAVCETQTLTLEEFVPAIFKKIIKHFCIETKYRYRFVSAENVPSYFRDGSVAVILRGHQFPAVFEYSFLHMYVVDPEYKQHRRERKAKSKAIGKQLSALYGPPNSTGYYDQSSFTGFISDQGHKRPCNLWVVEDIGILLCSERVVMIDGIEMSLSFINLDAVPFGVALKCMANQRSSGHCHVQPHGG